MDQRVQTVINLMRDNISRKLSLSEMAQLVNLSPSRLRYLFRAETGIPPTQYLRLIRMEQARSLLETTFLSVKEIMNNIGVNDESHFMRDFKKTHGVTPARYRTRLAANNNAPNSTENLDGLAVLVVEDDIETREMIRILLEGAGAGVTTVASARQALTALARSRPHVLIIDIGLPGQDGYALMRQVQRLYGARGEKIPAVALTAYTRLEDRTRALSAGFNIHVPKPPDPGQLIAAVAKLTGPGKA